MLRGMFMALVGVAVLLAGVLALRTLRLPDRQLPAPPAAAVEVDASAVAAELAGAITFATVSHLDPAQIDPRPFAGLSAYLRQTFPRFHAAATREVIGGHSLLYLWPGTRPDLEPVLLLAHMDVVPVPADQRSRWRVDPFAGTISGAEVWGRGALDDKGSLIAQLHAAEALLARGHQPQRSVWFAFGHDEEIGGLQGARAMADVLAARGVRPRLILDEGMFVSQGVLPGVASPAAMIGIAEKGYLSVELTVAATPGHSSVPPRDQAIAVLGAAVARLAAQPFAATLDGPARTLLEWIAPQLPWSMRLGLANLWLLEPIVLERLTAAPNTAALVRTTTAVTMFQAGVKDNVLPAAARAVVNFRVRPGESQATTLTRARAAVADERVAIAPLPGGISSEPSPPSPTAGPVWQQLHLTVAEAFPDAIVAPSLVLGATDARHYAGLSEHVYRFGPWRLGKDDLARVHGIDERVAVPSLVDAVRFYTRLIVNTTS